MRGTGEQSCDQKKYHLLGVESSCTAAVYNIYQSGTGALDLRVLWPRFVMRLRRDKLRMHSATHIIWVHYLPSPLEDGVCEISCISWEPPPFVRRSQEDYKMAGAKRHPKSFSRLRCELMRNRYIYILIYNMKEYYWERSSEGGGIGCFLRH